MRLNERQRRWMIENDLLLESGSHLDGSIEAVFSKVKGSLAEFGEVTKAAVGLVSTDVIYLFRLTFGSLFFMGREKRAKLKAAKNRSRNAFLGKVQKGWNTDGLDKDQKFMMCMLNPAAFFGGLGLATVSKPFDPQWRAQIGDYGLELLPWPLGGDSGLFGGDFKWSDGRMWDQIQDAKSAEDAMKILTSKLDGILKNTQPTGEGGPTDVLGIPPAALALTGLFLLADEDEHPGDVIQEGEESKEGADETRELTDRDYKLLRKYIEQKVEEHFNVPQEELLKLKEKELKAYIGDIPKAVETVCTLGGTSDPKEFMKGLESLKNMLGAEAKKVSVEDIAKGFEEAKDKLKNDKGAMEKLQKSLEEGEDEITEELVEDKLNDIVLDTFKSKFLQQLKEGLEDLLEQVHDEIWDGMSQKQLKLVKQTPVGKAYHKLCQKYENQIKDGVSKLKQS